LYERTKFFHESNVWKMLDNIDYSLQVVLDRASQRDEAERVWCKIGATEVLLDPSMAVFIDESAKGRNASQWRRHWSVRGKKNTFYWHRLHWLPWKDLHSTCCVWSWWIYPGSLRSSWARVGLPR
jgi:hypothetical protein